MSTIKEISQLAGVSMTTVSRVLNHDEALSVTQQVRSQIFKIAHELRYVPPRQRKAAQGDAVRLGIADWHIVRGGRPNIQIASLDCTAQDMGGGKNLYFQRIIPGELQLFDGIIAFGSYSEEELELLRTQSPYIVFINSDKKDYAYSRIIMDFDEGLRRMTDYLLHKKEYPSVGYIGGIYSQGTVCIGRHRAEGLRLILEQTESYDPAVFHIGEISRESGYLLAKEAAASGGLARAMLLGSDEVAEGALEAFREAGLRVPEDVAVVIYKDIETLESKWPTYTSIRMFPEVVWRTAIKLLLDHMSGSATEAMTICLPTKLETGDSA